MGTTVTERGVVGCIRREVRLWMMVFPGVDLLADHPEEGETVSVQQLRHTADRIRTQLQRVFVPFTYHVEDGLRIEYSFNIHVRTTFHEDRPVRHWTVTGGTTQESQMYRDARGYGEVLREAQSEGFDNVGVIHPNLGGRNVQSPRISEDGLFSPPRRGGRIMGQMSNLMTADRVRLARPDNQTAAHEMTHLLGMDHHGGAQAIAQGGEQLTGRVLTPMVQQTLHEIIQTFRPNQGLQWNGYHTRFLTPHRPRRRQRRRR